MGIDHSNPYIHSTTVLCDTHAEKSKAITTTTKVKQHNTALQKQSENCLPRMGLEPTNISILGDTLIN